MTTRHSHLTPGIRRAILTVTATMVAALFSASVIAEPPPGKGHKRAAKPKHEASNTHDHDGGALRRAGITIDRARQLAVQHQAVGYQGLPPGIAKNLARGKPLPPGIAKKAVPAGVLAGLPQYPGYEWGVAGVDLILISVATQLIAEVLSGVFR